MGATYTLKVLTDFAAAHTLRDYPGACSRLHGHNWKLEVEVRAEGLDDIGMGIDFKVIKQAANKISGRLDHQYLNEIPPFDKVNPTAENIAAYLFHGIADELNNERLSVHAVTLWENDRSSVCYSEAKQA